jgi:beta-lactamase superfamily II metal-dependent hydrolase
VFTKGKSWSSGGVDFELLHPPETAPSSNGNPRSMVIEVGYKGFKMLLTGDFRFRRQGEI